jgi:hypothetical protein
MTSLERLRAAVDLQECDRPPFADNEWPDFLSALAPCLAKCLVRDDGRYSEEERVAAACASLDMTPWQQTYASEGARYGHVRRGLENLACMIGPGLRFLTL